MNCPKDDLDEVKQAILVTLNDDGPFDLWAGDFDRYEITPEQCEAAREDFVTKVLARISTYELEGD